MQDLIDCDVLLQKDDSLIGKVLDVYDGTGRSPHAVLMHMAASLEQSCDINSLDVYVDFPA